MLARLRSGWSDLSRPIRLGLVLFALGCGFIVADVVPFFADVHNRPLWLNLACLLAPVGFAIAIGSAIRRGRAEQRAAQREATRASVQH